MWREQAVLVVVVVVVVVVVGVAVVVAVAVVVVQSTVLENKRTFMEKSCTAYNHSVALQSKTSFTRSV